MLLTFTRFAFAIMLFSFFGGTSNSVAAQGCHAVSLDGEREKAARPLVATGYVREQAEFLMQHSKIELYAFPRALMTDEAKACGRKAIQALIFGCINDTLEGTLAAVPNLDPIKTMPMWGRNRLSARELAFIAMFHTCQGDVREIFERH